MRRRTPAEVGLRAELAERDRWYAAEWRAALPEDESAAHRWERRAAALDAGEPVEVSAWELPQNVWRGRFAFGDRVTVEPDGSLTLARSP